MNRIFFPFLTDGSAIMLVYSAESISHEYSNIRALLQSINKKTSNALVMIVLVYNPDQISGTFISTTSFSSSSDPTDTIQQLVSQLKDDLPSNFKGIIPIGMQGSKRRTSISKKSTKWNEADIELLTTKLTMGNTSIEVSNNTRSWHLSSNHPTRCYSTPLFSHANCCY